MKSLKGLLLLLSVAAAAAVLASCLGTAPGISESEGQDPEAVAGGAFPMTVTDFEEREIRIEKAPQRIVSLAPGITEILFELGAGGSVVGVTDYDDYPKEVLEVAKVGNFNGPNMERIAAQRPDIIFASTLSGKNSMEALQRLGIPVLVLEARNLDQIYSSIKTIGKITGKADEGDALIEGMKSRMDDIKARVSAYPRKRVFYIVDLSGSFTAGSGTFIDQLITMAGGKNVAGDMEGWARYSTEELVQKNPEVIISAAHAGDISSLNKLPGYTETDAVKKGRVYVISDDNIISRTSARIVLGLEEIAGYLHPDAF